MGLGLIMTINVASPEVLAFMLLFAKLKEWSEDDADCLPELASTDESIKKLCLRLLKAAGSLQRNQRDHGELFIKPVDPRFISAWRDFEERFAHALLMVRSNDVDAGEATHFLSFDWYEAAPRWEEADWEAAERRRQSRE
jgi:hypothetical protein